MAEQASAQTDQGSTAISKGVVQIVQIAVKRKPKSILFYRQITGTETETFPRIGCASATASYDSAAG
jgi:hypothetical protein